MAVEVKYQRIPKTIGGRAVKNGVFLRGKKHMAVTVRSGETLITRVFDIRKPAAGKSGISALIDIGGVALDGVRNTVEIAKLTRSGDHGSLKTTLKYHGAEHKTIHCYEKGLPLTVENVSKQPLYHPRCGTSLAANLAVTRLAMYLVPARIRNAAGGLPDIALTAAAVGLSVKAWHYSGRRGGVISRILRLPGRAVQKLTVKEPDADMLACAIECAGAVMESQREVR